MNANIIISIKEDLTRRGIIDLEHDTNAVLLRQRGKSFTTEEHLRALVYSLLTNQRKWSDVEPKLSKIDNLFFDYNVDSIKSHDGSYFENGIRALKCGNIAIKMQMAGLHQDIKVFEKIIEKYGSIDAFVTHADPETIVRMISTSGQYKLVGVGNALAWEYLRNVGIDGAKPDVHMKRFMGSERMAVSNCITASDDEVMVEVEKLARETGLTKFEIDFVIWNYCADGKGEICTAQPKCSNCIIREYCKKSQK